MLNETFCDFHTLSIDLFNHQKFRFYFRIFPIFRNFHRKFDLLNFIDFQIAWIAQKVSVWFFRQSASVHSRSTNLFCKNFHNMQNCHLDLRNTCFPTSRLLSTFIGIERCKIWGERTRYDPFTCILWKMGEFWFTSTLLFIEF